MLKIFLIVTVTQRNMCCYYHYNCYRCCCAICFQRRSGRMSPVFSDLLLPRAVGDCNNIFYCSSFQKVRLILAKCEKNLVLSLFYWTTVMMSMGVVHQQYFTALIAKLLCPLSRIGHACDWQAQRLSESVKAVAKSTFCIIRYSPAFRWKGFYWAYSIKESLLLNPKALVVNLWVWTGFCCKQASREEAVQREGGLLSC